MGLQAKWVYSIYIPSNVHCTVCKWIKMKKMSSFSLAFLRVGASQHLPFFIIFHTTPQIMVLHGPTMTAWDGAEGFRLRQNLISTSKTLACTLQSCNTLTCCTVLEWNIKNIGHCCEATHTHDLFLFLFIHIYFALLSTVILGLCMATV